MNFFNWKLFFIKYLKIKNIKKNSYYINNISFIKKKKFTHKKKIFFLFINNNFFKKKIKNLKFVLFIKLKKKKFAIIKRKLL